MSLTIYSLKYILYWNLKVLDNCSYGRLKKNVFHWEVLEILIESHFGWECMCKAFFKRRSECMCKAFFKRRSYCCSLIESHLGWECMCKAFFKRRSECMCKAFYKRRSCCSVKWCRNERRLTSFSLYFGHKHQNLNN